MMQYLTLVVSMLGSNSVVSLVSRTALWAVGLAVCLRQYNQGLHLTAKIHDRGNGLGSLRLKQRF